MSCGREEGVIWNPRFLASKLSDCCAQYHDESCMRTDWVIWDLTASKR